jgi:hypothetical protein
MNLIEARKLAYDGWIRSDTRTGRVYVKVRGDCFVTESNRIGDFSVNLSENDLDADDWEPKPAPPKPFEMQILVHPNGDWTAIGKMPDEWMKTGWRKILVREVEG